jgi:hypothetical protein
MSDIRRRLGKLECVLHPVHTGGLASLLAKSGGPPQEYTLADVPELRERGGLCAVLADHLEGKTPCDDGTLKHERARDGTASEPRG